LLRLLIDAGNTNIKIQQVEGDRCQPVSVLPVIRACELEAFFPAAGLVCEVWVSNVAGSVLGERIRLLCAARGCKVTFIASQAAQCGVHNNYAQPLSLGTDRWASLIAAWSLQRRTCLVVGSGTATTIDALSDRGEFLGGLILPGIALMQQALAGATAQLQVAGGKYVSFPLNTADAMFSGALQATYGAIRLQYARLAADDAQVLLCGGAARLLSEHLNVPLQIQDNLVLQGLLIIARERGGA